MTKVIRVNDSMSWSDIRHIILATKLTTIKFRRVEVINLGNVCQVWESGDFIKTVNCDDAAHYLKAAMAPRR